MQLFAYSDMFNNCVQYSCRKIIAEGSNWDSVRGILSEAMNALNKVNPTAPVITTNEGLEMLQMMGYLGGVEKDVQPPKNAPTKRYHLLVILSGATMRHINCKRGLSTAFLFIIGATVAWEVHAYFQVREPLRAKTTEARMSALMTVLDAEQPRLLDAEHLRPLLVKYNQLACVEDGWGRPFVIEHGSLARSDGYTITSLGREGRRSHCCQKFVENWDANAVLSGSQWLQVWYPKAVQVAKKQKATK